MRFGGESDPARLSWLDPPPTAAIKEGRKTLVSLDAIDALGHITLHGRKLAGLPLPPNLAHMVVTAAAGQCEQAATLALLMQERGLGGQGEDIEARLDRFSRERGSRADAVRSLAKRIGSMARSDGNTLPRSIGALVATAFPDRVAKRRDAKGENWISAMGRGLRLDATSPLASAEWLAVADVQGAASGARILSAAAMTEAQVLALFDNRIETSTDTRYDAAADRVEVRQRRRLRAITMVESVANAPDKTAIAQALLNAVQAVGISVLPWSYAARALRQRASFAGVDVLSDAALLASLEDWMLPLLGGVSRLRDVSKSGLSDALNNLLGWDGKQRIEQIAPASFTTPAGTTHSIDYAAEAGPTIELRVQALFGCDTHPVVGIDRIPLVLSLTSPAGRPIQTTRNLPEFWREAGAMWPRKCAGAIPSTIGPMRHGTASQPEDEEGARHLGT